MAGPQLSYTVSPDTVPCSAGESQLSVVSLTVTATNATGAPVSVSAIDVGIPGSGWSTPGDVPYDPSPIAAAPGDATPWAIAGAGDGAWRALPLPPATAIPAGAAVSFVFTGVVVNLMPSTSGGALLPIVEWQGTEPADASVAVTKTEAVGPYVEAPTITSFAATPAEVGLGEPATLAWAVAGVAHDGSSGIVTVASDPPAGSPDPVPVTPPDAGTLTVTVPETTVFRLLAQTSGGSATGLATVTVMPASIVAPLTASPSTAAAGDPVTLDWEVAFAPACSIDHGVGPVGPAGPATVNPSQTTIYTLTTTGLHPQQSSVVVTVT